MHSHRYEHSSTKPEPTLFGRFVRSLTGRAGIEDRQSDYPERAVPLPPSFIAVETADDRTPRKKAPTSFGAMASPYSSPDS
jgi:hypothetical protein